MSDEFVVPDIEPVKEQAPNGAKNVRNMTKFTNGWLSCEIEHPTYGWIPFSLDPNDTEQSSLDVLAYIKKNKIKISQLPDHPSIALNVPVVAREWRDSELSRADIVINKIEDFEIEGDSKPWRQYRVKLRNWPDTTDFPTIKPVAPDGV